MRRSEQALLAFVLLASVSTALASVPVELAGESLGGYPYFERVRSFDRSMPIEIAIDPSQHPGLVGVTCDSYVVADRSAVQWQADPGLVDITSGGATSVTVMAGSIQANRFTLAAPAELPSVPALGLGVPYDVVLDCNRNGVLDDNDLADGASDDAGLYAVADTTAAGPLATSQVEYGSGNSAQIAYYPSAIATLGALPIVVVSHGWTHDYHWYGHIGHHLASYGYVVMSHWNDVGSGGPPATNTAATTTLSNLDYLLSSATAALPFAGHLDSHRIVLIGHSTGGEGVVRAYTRLRLGLDVPQNYSVSDIVLLAPIAPVAWLGPQSVNPFDIPFHMFAGAADTDTSNAPWDTYVQLMVIYERARGHRQLTYVHGAGHADFHNGTQPSEDWAEGPDLIGRARTHEVVRGYLLPLVELYVRGNPAARDFFTRMDGSFRPLGINPSVVLAREQRDGVAAGAFVLDDYQSQPDSNVSSSGRPVAYTVSNLSEILMRDVDQSFAWTGAQPANGMTRARTAPDDARCVVFDWAPGSPVYYELAVPATQRDFTDDGALAFRAAQGTRHPATVALAAPLTFSVTLRDGAGTTSTIPIASYGAITSPYKREGYGAGGGWANEFNTVRLAPRDFLTDGSSLDLGNIVAVRFEFGGAFGSARGRLALDDVELTDRAAAAPFVLALGRAGATAQLGWPAQPQALAFHVYRGTIPEGGFPARGTGEAVYDHVCYEAADAFGDGPFVSTDADPVPAGTAGYYYLVSIVTAAGEGSLGQASIDLDPDEPGDQLERPNAAPCP